MIVPGRYAIFVKHFLSSHKLPSEVMFLMTFTSRSLKFEILKCLDTHLMFMVSILIGVYENKSGKNNNIAF